MSVVEKIASQKINFVEEGRLYLNTTHFFANECISDINKASLRRLLLAFFRENFLPYFYQEDDLIFDLPRSNYLICIKKIELASLLRFKNFGPVFLIHKLTDLKQIITDPLKLLDIVQVELDADIDRDQWNKFYKEVANHLQNALLSSWKKYSLINELIHKSKASHFLEDSLRESKNNSHYSLKFEQAVFDGHPYHPCAKTKLGFTMEDTLNYSPEFQSKVGIFIAAVQREYVHIEAMKLNAGFTEWFSHHYPDVWDIWLQALHKQCLKAEDYIPFPAHPWQVYYFTSVSQLFKQYFEDNIIIFFNNVKLMASPTLSFRTLLPTENSKAPYIKLPVAVQATSIFRTLSPISTKNVPRISRILKEVLIKENYFSNRLNMLLEVYGLHLHSLKIEKGQHFSAIFRENIANYLSENEVAIVVAAFFEKSFITDDGLFIEMMKLSGILNYQGALNYFFHYTNLLLSGYLDIYLLYGIALEGHQQNTFAVFENGHIKRFVARDFDGIEIHSDSLKSTGITLDISLDSPCLKKNKESVRNQLLHTVYQLHLGELVLLLAEYFDCEETVFWNIVKQVTEQRFYQLKSKMDPSDWQIEYDAILQLDWPLKALLRMRLEKEYLCEGLFFRVSNPLSH